MATIGTFSKSGDRYSGAVRTLTLNVKAHLKARAALDRGIDTLIDGRISKEEWTKRRPELDARVNQGEPELALCKTRAKVDLHPEALRQYRASIDSLHDLLGQDATEANNTLFEAFRDLVHSVIVWKVAASSPVSVEIFGKLSALTGEPISKLMIAGACNKRSSHPPLIRLAA